MTSTTASPSMPALSTTGTAATAGEATSLHVGRSRCVSAVLAAARAGLDRLTVHEAVRAQADGALLVDTRTSAQRATQGEIPGAVVVDRTVLEWRLDPSSPWRIPEMDCRDRLLVVLCRQGYSSSLAAASLRAVGVDRATDVIGGVEAWLAAGLPVHRGPADVRT